MLDRIADGRTDLVFEFVAAGGNVDSKDQNGVSLIQWCGYYGDVSAIRFLLGKCESLDSLGDNFDLNRAAFHGHWQLCEFLVERGADVNRSLPDNGETPLHSALCTRDRLGHDRVVKVLLAKGADPNCVNQPAAETGVLCAIAVPRPRPRCIAQPRSETSKLFNFYWTLGENRREGYEWGYPAQLGKLVCSAGYHPAPALLWGLSHPPRPQVNGGIPDRRASRRRISFDAKVTLALAGFSRQHSSIEFLGLVSRHRERFPIARLPVFR